MESTSKSAGGDEDPPQPKPEASATMEPSTSLPAGQLLEVMIKEEDKELITLSAEELEIREAELKRRKYEMLKEFRCELCGKYFHRLADLKRHSIRHTGVRPYGCSLCGKAFAQKPHLATHMLLHEAKRPFSCPHCDKGYTQRQKLDSHIKIIHENDRPYTCDLCGKTFARPDTYKLHVKRHDGYRPYACHLCPRTFTQSYHYKNHMAIHNDSNTNICDRCDRSFADKGSLNRHMRKIHKIDTGGRSDRYKVGNTNTTETGGLSLTSTHTSGYANDAVSSEEVSLTTLRALEVCGEAGGTSLDDEPFREISEDPLRSEEPLSSEDRKETGSNCTPSGPSDAAYQDDDIPQSHSTRVATPSRLPTEESAELTEPYQYYNERVAYNSQPQYSSTLSDYLSQILASCRR